MNHMEPIFQDLHFYCTKKVPKKRNFFSSLSSRGWNPPPGASSDLDLINSSHFPQPQHGCSPCQMPGPRSAARVVGCSNRKSTTLSNGWLVGWWVLWIGINPRRDCSKDDLLQHSKSIQALESSCLHI